jgi:hypothetical protein
MLYQSLAIEHPAIKFSFILPATVEGDFRSSAVDIGEARPPDSKIRGLKQIAVAERCIKAVDQSDRTVFMPPSMRVAPFLYWIWPWYIEQQAKKLYNF